MPKSKAVTAPAVHYRPLDSLEPYARNSRTHSDKQLAQLCAGITDWGWTNPVLADADGIVAGHGRVLAARRLYDAGETLYLAPGREHGGQRIPDGMVPVLDCSGWPDAKRRAYIIADNKLGLNAGWDDDLLRAELEELAAADFDTTLIGFDDRELAAILGDAPPMQGGGTDPNAEWDGMPEFDQQDQTAFRTIKVHFKSQSDVDSFASLIAQSITDKTRFLWYPWIETAKVADKRYAQIDDEAGDGEE